MVSIHQHELGVARNEGYAKGHAAATGYFTERICEMQRTHRSIIDTKNEALVRFARSVETKNELIHEKNIEIRELSERLRRQLLEQAAIIDALQQSLEEATARIEALTAKPEPDHRLKVGDIVRRHDGTSPFEIVSINSLGSLDIRSHRTNAVYHCRNAAHYVRISEPPFKVGDFVKHENRGRIYEIHATKEINGRLHAQFEGFLTCWSRPEDSWFPLDAYSKVS